MINPITGLEEEADYVGAKGYNKSQIGIPGVNLIEKTPIIDSEKTPIIASEGVVKEEGYKGDVVFGGGENIQKSQVDLLKEQEEQRTADLKIKYDANVEKQRKDNEKTIDDTYKTYNVAKGEYEQNKSYYDNYDTVNNTFDSVLKDMQGIQSNNGGSDITDQEYQTIADRYGLNINDVKNPNNIFDSLKLNKEGEDKFGITDYNKGLTDLETTFNRNKEDIATNLANTQEDVANQIEDVERQLEINVGWATAQGAWMGGLKSSGYGQGIQNIKDDGARVVDRLQASLEKVENANDTTVSRLTTDYNDSVTEVKKGLDTQLKDLVHNNGLKLNGLTEKYGLGSDDLTNALNDIQEEFGTASMESYNNYLTGIRNIQAITNTKISQYEQMQDIEKSKTDERYNEYIDNGGILLENTSLLDLTKEVTAGTITQAKYKDLKNIITYGITDTLGAFGIVDTADLTKIDTLLNQGKTPTEVLAEMKKDDKFKESITKTLTPEKIGERDGVDVYGTYNDVTGQYDEIDMSKEENVSNIARDNAISNYGESAAVRNFNPGNIMDLGFGGKKVDGERFTVFDSPQEGFNALVSKIENIQSGNSTVYSPDMTITEYISKYAPASDNNDVGAYAQSIADDLGVDINTTIGQIDPNSLALAHAKHEDGASYKMLQDLGITKKATITPVEKALSEQTKEEMVESGDFDKTSIPMFENYLTNGKLGTSVAELSTIEKEFGSTENFKQQAENYNNSEGGPRQAEIDKITKLKDKVEAFLSDDMKGARDDSVGFMQTSASPWAKLKKENFLGKVQNFLDGKTLQNLIDVKSEGATFGALSNEELRMLQASADVISSDALRDDKNDKNRITGFRGGEATFKENLQNTLDIYNEIIAKKEKKMGKGSGIETPSGFVFDETPSGAGTTLGNNNTDELDKIFSN